MLRKSSTTKDSAIRSNLFVQVVSPDLPYWRLKLKKHTENCSLSTERDHVTKGEWDGSLEEACRRYQEKGLDEVT